MDDYKHVRIHLNLTCGETISFEKFHKDTDIITVFKNIMNNIINKERDIIKIYIYNN